MSKSNPHFTISFPPPQYSGTALNSTAKTPREEIPREQRFLSHAIVELRQFRLLPFGVHSALLLDISLGGFKVEFTGEFIAIPGNQYWLAIPLPPLGIYSPRRLICRCECRWNDQEKFRMGGVFTEITKKDQLLIEQIVASLESRKNL